MSQDTEIALEVKIKAAEAANTVKELKSSLKGLKDELNGVEAGSAQFKKLSKSINETEGKLGDLNDSFNTLKGSGIERTTSSINLLKEGFANFDTGKIKAGLSGIGAAMKALPIFLIVEGIIYLVQNFKELSQGSGLLAKSLRVVGDVIDYAVDLLYKFTDLIGLTNSELDKQGEAIKEYADKVNEALASQVHEFDNQIKAAKAAGKSTIELEQAKQQAIIDTNKLILEQIIAFVRAGGELDEEKKKLFNASTQFIKDAKVEQRVIEINHNKEVNTEYKKSLDEKAKLDKEYNAEFARQLDLTVQSKIENEARDKQAIEDKKNAEMAAMLESHNEGNALYAENKKRDAEGAEKKVETVKWTSEQEKATINETLAVAKMSFESQAQLSNFLFDLKRKNLIKGSAEDLKLAKRQFQINKALAIQSSIISGIQGVINALSAQSVIPEPFGTILKVATAVGVGIAATINTAKIASQQFNEGGGGGSVSADVGGLGSGAAPAVPTPNNTVTKIEDDGTVKKVGQPVVKAIVVESDMTEKQQRVNTIQESAKFG